jgi:hypothetical protein
MTIAEISQISSAVEEQGAATELSKQAETLGSEVDQFIARIRTA